MVAILCYDEGIGGARFVRGLMPAEVFDPYYREIVTDVHAYIDKYEKPPKDHTLDIVDALKARAPDKADIFEQLFNSIEEIFEGLNVEYMVGQAKAFAQHQKLKAGITEALDELSSNDEAGTAQAAKALSEALEGSLDLFHPGLNVFDTTDSLGFLDITEQQYFTTGIPEFDKRGLAPTRKRLHIFTALPGRGKSWWLVNLVKQAVLHKKSVVYVTLELSEHEVSQRVMQCLFSVAKRNSVQYMQEFESDELGRFTGMEPFEIKDRPTLADNDIREVLEGKVRPFQERPPIIIRQFPTGSITIRDLDAYLDSLEVSRSFVPDLLIVDYADLMNIETQNYRHALGKLYKDLRGIAVKRNIAVATASQSNREGSGATTITEKHIAEDFSKVGTTDYLITYNQTQDEKNLGLARLFVAKGRTDEDKFTVLISQAYGLGQFVLDSARMSSGPYWDSIKQAADDE